MNLESTKLRNMTFEDLTWVWQVRNTIEVRSMSTFTGEISWPAHLEWWKSDKVIKRKIFSIMGKSVGVVTLNYAGYWAFYKNPAENNGTGIATSMLREFISILPPGYILKAQVKKTNTASNRIHHKLGFEQVESDNEELNEYQFIVPRENLCPA